MNNNSVVGSEPPIPEYVPYRFKDYAVIGGVLAFFTLPWAVPVILIAQQQDDITERNNGIKSAVITDDFDEIVGINNVRGDGDTIDASIGQCIFSNIGYRTEEQEDGTVDITEYYMGDEFSLKPVIIFSDAGDLVNNFDYGYCVNVSDKLSD